MTESWSEISIVMNVVRDLVTDQELEKAQRSYSEHLYAISNVEIRRRTRVGVRRCQRVEKNIIINLLL